MKRRKPLSERKEAQVRVLLTPTQKRALTEAAAKAGLSVASWLRATGLREAARLLEK